MQTKITQLTNQALLELENVQTTKQLYDLRVAFLGKSGQLTALLKALREFVGQERAFFGKVVNDAKVALESAFDTKNTQLKLQELTAQLHQDKLDISIDKKIPPLGARHPVSIVKDRIVQFFVKLGFVVIDAPEIETEYYNFEALNVASDHPARDMQDTFFVGDGRLLRSHTSNGQVRAMQTLKPPFRVLSPGRVYRADDMDATHSPMFHQVEGLVVDKGLTMCDLKGCLELFAKFIFGQDTTIRFRPSYFPFTEPSVEVDASCNCTSGCKICKSSHWIEILGAGMVNRAVLKNCGVDKSYNGFAFGLGVERITNLIFGIDDMRTLYENDMRFLAQFA